MDDVSVERVLELAGSARPSQDRFRELRDLMAEIISSRSELLTECLTRSAEVLDQSSPDICAALSFVADEELRPVAEACMERLRHEERHDDCQAAWLVALLSLQRPDLLEGNLDVLHFRTGPWNVDDENTPYWDLPWRGASPEELSRLVERLHEGGEVREVWYQLLASGTDQGLQAALDAAGSIVPYTVASKAALNEAGYDWTTTGLRRLWLNPPHHLIPRDTAQDQWSGSGGGATHPTWDRSAPISSVRFGGPSTEPCGICGMPLSQLLALDEVPHPSVRSASGPLQLVTCLSCLDWEAPVLYFSHAGPPRPIGKLEPAVPEFAVAPPAESEFVVAATERRWWTQDWGLSNGNENLNRLGGAPTWVQGPDHPPCPMCDQLMPFLLQLDSDIARRSLLGVEGVLYVHWCDACSVSATHGQRT